MTVQPPPADDVPRMPPAWRSVLRVMRFPAPLTAPADVLAGHALLGAPGWPCPGILVASGLLYGAGMVLNDVADREVDARLRPERPLPSGHLRVSTALGGGLAMLAIAVGLGWWRAQAVGAIGVGAVALAVLLYDFVLKRSAVGGALGMALCRSGNLLLGAAGAGLAWWSQPIPAPLLWGVGAMALYIAGLTTASQAEDQEVPTAVKAGALLAMLGALGLMFHATDAPEALGSAPLVVLGCLLLSRWSALSAGPAGRFVGAGVLGVPLLGAGAAMSAGRWDLGTAAVGLLVAGLVLRRALVPRARVD